MAGLDRQPVLLVWMDAHASTETWTPLEEIDPAPCLIHTVGLLLPEIKPGHVSVAQSVDEDDRVDSVLCVPVDMVVRMEDLPTEALLRDKQPRRRPSRSAIRGDGR